MKILEENSKPLDVFCEASRILNEAVEHTIGPNGTNTAIQNKEGLYEIINDGKAIIEEITSIDPVLAPALETLKQASFETNKKAGDGTTSTTIIMNRLLQGAKLLLDEGLMKPVELRNKLEEIKNQLLCYLAEVKIDITEDQYDKVAEVALGGTKYSNSIADVFRFLGKGKRPTLIKSDVTDIEIEQINGVNLTKSKIVSNLFLETTEHTDLNCLFVFEPINRFQEMTQLLRKVQQTDKLTLLFYNQLSTDILENILFNYTNGAIKLIPICLGGYGKGTYTVMCDLAAYTKSSIIDNTTCKITDTNKIEFGTIDYALINQDQVILKNNDATLPETSTLDDKSALIRIGGTNKVEREETYRRIEDAINSLGNAIEYGIVEGAGATYAKICDMLDVEDSLDIVYDAMHTIDDLLDDPEEPVYDSAMVIREVIVNAFTVVGQVITTHTLIHDNIR